MTKYSALSDLELIDDLKSGDHAAFNEIFKRYKYILFIFANRRLNDKERTQDLIHDTFADLWTKRSSLDVNSLQAYLFTVIKNKILDQVKHDKVSDRYIDSLRTVMNNTKSEPADYRARYNNLSALIDKEVAALPEIYRTAFELSRKKTLTSKQIAE